MSNISCAANRSPYQSLTGLAVLSALVLFIILLLSSTPAFAAGVETLTVSHIVPTGGPIPAGPQSPSQSLVGDVLQFNASAGDHTITVDSIRVRQSGTTTALDSDITAIRLVRDTNADGIYDASDTPIASTSTAASIAEFSSLNFQVAQNSTETVFVVYTISPSAVIGHTLQSNLIFTNSDITVVTPDVVADFGVLTGATRSVASSADTVSITHNPPATAVVTQGASVLVDRIDLSAPPTGDGATIDS
ncbi:MAG TPA: hypothetical protein VGK02_03730, partial [Candidatus Aquicultor sp.]